MSAKGMNLALHDAEVFANAVVHRQAHDRDTSLLDAYSPTCLRHVWNYQAFAAWWTGLIHNAGDASYRGEFRHRIARAELARLFEPGTANRLLSEFLAGLNQPPGGVRRARARPFSRFPGAFPSGAGRTADVIPSPRGPARRRGSARRRSRRERPARS
ncbi:hypothetical protein ACQEVS_07535 [Streptomyces sp. CA-181903]|uniref:hypothetical protein n=1 Tax=Streptomyces sp. CA-181903 TaxID=3240055 RepID=UPI003D931196